MDAHLNVNLCHMNKLTFNLDQINKHYALNADIDPDLNFLTNRLQDSQYAPPSSLTAKFDRYKGISNIMHINTRSVLSKVVDLQLLIEQLPVTLIALTEKWLTEETYKLFNQRIVC